MVRPLALAARTARTAFSEPPLVEMATRPSLVAGGDRSRRLLGCLCGEAREHPARLTRPLPSLNRRGAGVEGAAHRLVPATSMRLRARIPKDVRPPRIAPKQRSLLPHASSYHATRCAELLHLIPTTAGGRANDSVRRSVAGPEVIRGSLTVLLLLLNFF